MATAKNANPAVIDQNAAGFIDDCSHRRASCNLYVDQSFFARRVVRRWQHFNAIFCFGDPPLNDWPSRIIPVDQFVKLFQRCSHAACNYFFNCKSTFGDSSLIAPAFVGSAKAKRCVLDCR